MIDYPELTMYTVHPGVIMTEGADVLQTSLGIKGKVPTPDTVELAAATFLWLTSRNAEFLNGRCVQSDLINCDMCEDSFEWQVCAGYMGSWGGAGEEE